MFFSGGRGVAVNMRPCQGRDRRFESGRPRQIKGTTPMGVVLCVYGRQLEMLLCGLCYTSNKEPTVPKGHVVYPQPAQEKDTILDIIFHLENNTQKIIAHVKHN